jgi:hypothetical protein
VLWSFQIPSKAIYFHNLCWIEDSRGHRDHRTCVSTRRCYTCGTGVVALSSTMTLRSATSASSSMPIRGRNPRIWSSRVCHRIPVYRYNITNR